MRKIAATFSIIFAVLLSTIDSVSAKEPQLQVKVIDVDSINRNQIDPDFLANLQRRLSGTLLRRWDQTISRHSKGNAQ